MNCSNHISFRCQYSFYGCLLLALMLLIPAGCKKEAPQEAKPAEADAAKDSQPDAANPEVPKPADEKANQETPDLKAAENTAKAEDTAPKAAAPDAAHAKSCEKWGTNPLFKDGQTFNYEVKYDLAACCDLDKDNPDWKCDKDGMCELNKTIPLQCKTTLTHAESYFCATKIVCTEQDGKENTDFLSGHWFIDANGLYRLGSEKPLSLNKQAQPGNCKDIKNIQCKPETLAYEYQEFADEDPVIPFVKSDIHHDECFEDDLFCEYFNLTHKGSVWERVFSADGPDSSADALTLDETRGIVLFKTDFSGGSERHIEGKLK